MSDVAHETGMLHKVGPGRREPPNHSDRWALDKQGQEPTVSSFLKEQI